MNKSDSNVVIISTVLPRWESDFNALSSELADRGCNVDIYHPRPVTARGVGWRTADTIELSRKKIHPAIKCHLLPYADYNLGLLTLVRAALLGLKLAMRKNQLTIVWTILPILLFGPPLRLFNRRVIYQVTGLGSVFAEAQAHSRRRKITERIYSFIFSGENFRVIVHNREDKAFLCERFSISADKVHVTGGCGVEPDDFPFHQEYAGNPVPVIYSPIRLAVEKGVFDMCEASGLLEQRGIAHELWFTSEIDYDQVTSVSQSDADEITRKYSRIRFKGYQPSIVETLKQADLVCIPTWYREGLPTAILEAASSGRAIITTDNVGGRDFVRDGIDGRLVDIKSPDALASAIADLIENPEKVESMRQSAYRRFLSGFTKQHMVDITLNACGEIWPLLPGAVPTAKGLEQTHTQTLQET